jgi:hypothetical protein
MARADSQRQETSHSSASSTCASSTCSSSGRGVVSERRAAEGGVTESGRLWRLELVGGGEVLLLLLGCADWNGLSSSSERYLDDDDDDDASSSEVLPTEGMDVFVIRIRKEKKRKEKKNYRRRRKAGALLLVRVTIVVVHGQRPSRLHARGPGLTPCIRVMFP